MVKLLAILSVITSLLTFSAVAFPNKPGTCNITGMKAPHGTTPATDATFSISASMIPSGNAKSNAYKVKISGNGTFMGLLLYATDTAGKKTRFGSFKTSKGFSAITSCGGINPKSNTLGHNSNAVKKLPITFTWNSAGYKAGKPWTASFEGIIVTTGVKKWYIINATTINSKSSVIPTASVPSNATIAATDTPTPVGDSSATMIVINSAVSDTAMASNTAVVSDTAAAGDTAPMDGTSSSATHVSGSLVLSVLISTFAALLL